MDDPRFRTDARFKQVPIKKRKIVVDDERLTSLVAAKRELRDPRTGKRIVEKSEASKFLVAEKEPDEVAADSSSEEEEEEENIEMLHDDDSDDDIWQQKNSVPTGQEVSKRLALLGCDWENVTSKDLIVLLSGATDCGDGIESVSIYMSDLGLESTSYEAEHGPMLGVPSVPVLEGEDPMIDDIDLSDKEDDDDSENDDDEARDPKLQRLLRKYQKTRSKYYFAVVQLTSESIAETVYNALDGVDSDLFIDAIDLRFIPDDVTFCKTRLRDSETHASTVGYEPPPTLVSALRHSKLKCTWDVTPAHRHKKLSKRFTADELVDLDLKDYLASTDDDSGAEYIEGTQFEDLELPPGVLHKPPTTSHVGTPVEEFRRALLGAAPPQNIKHTEVVAAAEDIELTMEREPEKASSQPISVWQKYLDKRKEKKKLRTSAKKFEEPLVSEEEEEPKKAVKKKNRFPLVGAAAVAPSKADDDLLLFGRHNDLEEEPTRKRKKRKEKKIAKFQPVPKDDARFESFVNNPIFSTN